jgi:hypothetical protein
MDALSNPAWIQCCIQGRANTEEERASLLAISKHQLETQPLGIFENGLLLCGSEVHSASRQLAEQFNLRAVLRLGYPTSAHFLYDIESPVIEYREIYDEQSTLPIYRALLFINSYIQRGQSVLVYSTNGESQSRAIIIACLMWRHGRNYEDTLQAYYPNTDLINDNFVHQLHAFRSTITLSQVEQYLAEHIENVPDTCDVLLTDSLNVSISLKAVGDTITATEMGVPFLSASRGLAREARFDEHHTMIYIHAPFPDATDRWRWGIDDAVALCLDAQRVRERLVWPRCAVLKVDGVSYPYGNRRFDCHVEI